MVGGIDQVLAFGAYKNKHASETEWETVKA
jgi:hypothetical protein